MLILLVFGYKEVLKRQEKKNIFSYICFISNVKIIHVNLNIRNG